jgi:hypothetical protein
MSSPGPAAGWSRRRRAARLWGCLLVERLHPEHRDAFESLVHDARRERADDLAEEHQDASSPSSSCGLRRCKRVVLGQLLGQRLVRPRDDAVLDERLATAQEVARHGPSRPGPRAVRPIEADGFAGHLVFGEPQFHQAHVGALQATSAARTLAATVSVSRIATVLHGTGDALTEDGVVHFRVNVGQERVVEHGWPARRRALRERFLDRGSGAAE